MKPKPANLSQIERWMQSMISHPGGVAEGLDSPEVRAHLDVAAGELESVICRSRALDAESRLEIYVNAYYERLLECLREEFPATRAATGDELFDALAFGYLQQYPSHSYTLADLGAVFPRYLDESRLHAHAVPEGSDVQWPQFIVELAQLERVLREVFDGPGSEDRQGLDVATLRAAEDLRLTPAPDLRIAHFSHPVHRYWRSCKDGALVGPPRPAEAYLAIHRVNYELAMHELSGMQFLLLESLVAGSTLSESLASSVAQAGAERDALAAQLPSWFAGWVRRGFFIGVAMTARQ